MTKRIGFENSIHGRREQWRNKDLAFSKPILDLIFSKRYTLDGF
jgi:hypothetical protein